jgi:hypothetical protein
MKDLNVSRTNLVKYENGDLLTDSDNILNRWKVYFVQVLNVHGVNHITQSEIHTAESLILKPSSFELKFAIENLIMHQSPGTDQILAESTQVGGNTLYSVPRSTYILIPFGIRKNC